MTEQSEAKTRTAQQGWMVAAQLVALALIVVALCWAPNQDHPAPQRPYQAVLAVLALASLGLACAPRLRRGELAGVVGGVALGTACWLSAGHLWLLPAFADARVPLMTPVVLGAACVLALGGLIARTGRGGTRLGNGALVAALILAAFGLLFFGLINYSPYFKSLYQIDLYELQEILAIAVLYPLALWLGGVGIRPAARWSFQPACLGVILLGFLLHWHMR